MSDEKFFLLKGIAGIISVILLVYHMYSTTQIMSFAQRLRYITLLGFAVLVTGGSARQWSQSENVEIEHVGALIVSIFLIFTAIVSIRDERKKK